MNKIEQKFYDAFIDCFGLNNTVSDSFMKEKFGLECQKTIGIYVVDFYIKMPDPHSSLSFAVEIDGHEYHKTKEQREKDYKRERYLQRKGIIPIRFTGTEVFLDAPNCIRELLKIINEFDILEMSSCFDAEQRLLEEREDLCCAE